jgi:hypothetical protein
MTTGFQHDLFLQKRRDVAVQPTSAEAHRDIKASGVLGEMQAKVLDAIRKHGPITGRELDSLLALPGDAAASYHKRISELCDRGFVEVGEKRPCRITGRSAIAWRVKP